MSFDPNNMKEEIVPKRNWSQFQQNFFRFVLDDEDSCLLEAVAGSGKTTTIVHAAGIAKGRTAFLAFNRSIADNLRSKVPNAYTFHSFGMSVLRDTSMRFNKQKLSEMYKRHGGANYSHIFSQVRRLVDLAKGNAFGINYPSTRDDFIDLVDTFNIDFKTDDDERAAITIAKFMLEASTEDNVSEYDFSDMLYLPVKFNLPFPSQFHNILVDEAQDTAPIQRYFLDKMLLANGRVFAVGDTHQAIYGFRGADSNAMHSIKEHFNAFELPLSICYRCPTKVIELAQQIVPQIVAAPNAIEGIVNMSSEVPDIATLTPNDLLICRNNAPLMGVALEFLRRRLPMTLLGDFGEILTNFIRSFKTNDIQTFENKLNAWYRKENERLTREKRWNRLGAIRDRYESIQILIPGHKDVLDMTITLSKIFTPAVGPTISSIHRAKGSEADRVYIIEPELMPSKYARLEWEKEQEENLRYVAITRAKKELHFCYAEMENDDEEISEDNRPNDFEVKGGDNNG